MSNPFRHRENLTAEDVLNMDWGEAYKIERIVREELYNFER